MVVATVQPNMITYSNLVGPALSQAGWAGYLLLLEEMQRQRLLFDTQFLTASMVALTRNGAWQYALLLYRLDVTNGPDVRPDEFTFSAAISACAHGAQWQLALSLLPAGGENGAALSAAGSACAAAAAWQAGLQLAQRALSEGDAAEAESTGS
ncbi:unnamed protein product, partial [Effrenium voratum]